MRIILLLMCFLLLNCMLAKAQVGSCNEPSIPNIITPNNDGFNDALQIGCIENFPENELFIFDRWGQQIYHAFGYDNNWKGTWDQTKGDAPAGTYVYILSVQINGVEKKYQGALTIIR